MNTCFPGFYVLSTVFPFLCMILNATASTLYEDQRASTSWIKEFLGDVKSAALSKGRNISVIGSSDALAAVSLWDGQLLWRRQVQVDRMHIYDSLDRVVTVFGSELQAWAQSSGQLLWRTHAPGHDSVQATCPVQNTLVSVRSGIVSMFDIRTGQLRWSTAIAADSAHATMCSEQDGDALVAVVMLKSQQVRLVRMGIQSGSMVMSALVEVEKPLSSASALVNGFLFAISGDLGSLCTIHLAHLAKQRCICIPLLRKASGHPAMHASHAGAYVTIPKQSGNEVLVVSPRPTPVLVPFPIPVTAVSGTFLIQQTPAILALMAVDDSHELEVYIINAISGEQIHRRILQSYPAVHVDGVIAQPVQVWVNEAADGMDSVQFLLKAEDMSLWYNVGGQWQWGRDEALAEVIEVAVLEALQASSDVGQGLGHGGLMMSGRRGPDMGVTGFVDVATGTQVVELFRQLKQRFFNMQSVQGKQKVLVAACRNGMFYALNAADGRRVWARRVQRGMRLIAMESYVGVNTTITDVQVLVVLSGNSEAVAGLINAGTGSLDHVFRVPQEVTRVQSLDRSCYNHAGVLMIGVSTPFPKSLVGYVFPPFGEFPPAQQTKIWLSDDTSGEVIGYTIVAGDDGPLGRTILAEHSWTFSMRARLLRAVPVIPSAQSGNHVKVHGDRSMSFRYLSPNMALFVSEAEPGVPLPGLTLAILDTVTGQLLHSQFHAYASGPVAAAFDENVAMVHFMDMRTSRWEMTVMELYDTSSSGPSTLQMFWGAIGGTAQVSAMGSATNHVLLKVARASVFMRMGVREVHPIQTRFGIAPKHVLLATSMNQIYNLDTNLLDPDRLKVSRTHPKKQDHGAMMRSLQLGSSSQLFATYDKIVTSLRRIRTAPSQLESTIDLMAWGSDVYFATLRPSRGFDTLGEDFSFVLLLFALAVMTATVAAVGYVVQASRVQARWD